MPTITGMSYVTLSGTFLNLQTGGPAEGVLIFQLSGRLVNTTTDEIVVPEDFTASLDANGQFAIVLPATDDPDFLPTDRYWVVSEYIDGQSRRYAILLSAASPTQDLADIAPIDPTDPAAVYTLVNPPLVSTFGWTLPEVEAGAPGTDNIAAIQEALTSIGAQGGGVLLIPPLALDLEGTLEWDPQSADLVVLAWGAVLNFIGDGFVWELEGGGSSLTPRMQNFGGHWFASGDAHGFVRSTDANKGEWGHMTLENFTGAGSGSGWLWNIRNRDGQSERNHIHHIREVNCKRIGVFQGPTDWGNPPGTKSHARTRFSWIELGGGGVSGAGDYKFYFDDNAGMYDCTFDNIVGNIPDDLTALFRLGGGMGGTVIGPVQVESRSPTSIYTATLSGSPAGGSFDLTIGMDGETVDFTLAYDDTLVEAQAAVDAALVLLEDLVDPHDFFPTPGEAGTCVVSGATGAWVFTFSEGEIVATCDGADGGAQNHLTGGTDPAVLLTGTGYIFEGSDSLGGKPTIRDIKLRNGIQFAPTTGDGALDPGDFGGSAITTLGALNVSDKQPFKTGSVIVQKPRNTFVEEEGKPSFYKTTINADAPAYPFDVTGRLIIQGRSETGQGKGICIACGAPAVVVMQVESGGVTFHQPAIQNKYVEMVEQAGAPGAPATDHARLYCVDVAGKTVLRVRFATGASVTLASEP